MNILGKVINYVKALYPIYQEKKIKKEIDRSTTIKNDINIAYLQINHSRDRCVIIYIDMHVCINEKNEDAPLHES